MAPIRIIALLALASLLAGCGATREVAEVAVVRVFYATDRDHRLQAAPDARYGPDRAQISYGTSLVSIPRDHRLGRLEAPSVWRFELRADAARHVVLQSVEPQDKDAFFADLAARIGESADRRVFVFVHRTNVGFAEAARRTAQMAHDLGFDGAPVLFSWPSQGSLGAYTVDETNVEWARSDLQRFLEDVLDRSQAEHLFLIAHSMGNRALAPAVAALLTERPEQRGRIRELILTAPDIDADVFRRDIVPALAGAGQQVTLYAASDDFALAAAKRIHGYPRAGDSGAGLVVMPGLETVDATDADTSLSGHSYYAEAPSVLADMFDLVNNGLRAEQRFGLRPVETSAGRYWELRQ